MLLLTHISFKSHAHGAAAQCELSPPSLVEVAKKRAKIGQNHASAVSMQRENFSSKENMFAYMQHPIITGPQTKHI